MQTIKLKDFQSKAVFQIESLDCDFIFNKKNSNAGINFVKKRNPFIDDNFISNVYQRPHRRKFS